MSKSYHHQEHKVQKGLSSDRESDERNRSTRFVPEKLDLPREGLSYDVFYSSRSHYSGGGDGNGNDKHAESKSIETLEIQVKGKGSVKNPDCKISRARFKKEYTMFLRTLRGYTLP